MFHLRALLILIIFSESAFSQKIGSWKNYTDMKNITEVKIVEDGFWMTSTGGAGRYLDDFFDYDISEDLSMRVSPSAFQLPVDKASTAPGLKIALKF